MFEFEEGHNSLWEQPDNHALVQSDNLPIGAYSILVLEPRLLYMIVEDIEYAKMLAKKMIEHGVKIFDNFEDFLEWYNNRNR